VVAGLGGESAAAARMGVAIFAATKATARGCSGSASLAGGAPLIRVHQGSLIEALSWVSWLSAWLEKG